jgi:hypothetical protein
MSATLLTSTQRPWTGWEKLSFRVAFVFFVLLIIPLHPDWYKLVFNARSLFELMRDLTDYSPRWVTISTESGKWGWQSYANWGLALVIALAAAAVWTLLARKKELANYNTLYYWLRVIVRYRIALGVLDYGFMKFYPVQMPYPGLGVLTSHFGDLSGYKIYWQSVGVVPWYEVFLGCVEVFSAILLFFRPTTSIGAIVIAGVLYNVAHANHAYDGGVHVFSAMFALLALFLLVQDIPALWQLFIRREPAQSPDHKPAYVHRWKYYLDRSIKYLVVFSFVPLYGYLRYDLHYVKLHLKKPVTPGLSGAAGYYDVTSFRVNQREVPYSPLDSSRWQDVVWEKHSTLIIRINRPISIPQGNGSRQDKDVDRSYELAGVGGGRHFYYYDADTVHHVLYLQNKGQVALLNGEGRISKIKKSRSDGIPKLVWHFERPAPGRIILRGKNEQGEDLDVVLDRKEKKYLMESGL